MFIFKEIKFEHFIFKGNFLFIIYNPNTTMGLLN